jgi:hypothetical protein
MMVSAGITSRFLETRLCFSIGASFPDEIAFSSVSPRRRELSRISLICRQDGPPGSTVAVDVRSSAQATEGDENLRPKAEDGCRMPPSKRSECGVFDPLQTLKD